MRGKWETLPHFTFWSHETPVSGGYTLGLSRDRDLVSEGDLKLVYINFLVDSLSSKEVLETLKTLEPFYALPDNQSGYTRENHVGYEFLRLLTNRCEREGIKIPFNKDYVALDESDFLETLKGLGFKPCYDFLAHIGMIRASEMKNEILELQEYTPTPEHEKRIANLQSITRKMFQETDNRSVSHTTSLLGVEQGNSVGALARLSDLDAKEIRVFEGKHPYLKGLYGEKFVWVSKDSLETPDIEDALATYLHELCHKFGDDQSEIFSYALTDALRRLAKYARTHPEGIRNAQTGWESVHIDRAWKTIQDLETHLFSLTWNESSFEKRQRLDSQDTIDNLAQSLEKIVAVGFTQEDTATATRRIFDIIQRDPLVVQWRQQTEFSADATLSLSEKEVKILEETNAQAWKIDSLIQKLKGQIDTKLKELSTNPTIQQRRDGKWGIKREKLGIPQLEAEIELKEQEKKRLLESTKELREREERYKHSDRILLSLLQNRSPLNLHGVSLDALDASKISNFFHASLRLLFLTWEKKTMNRELFKKEFTELLAWAKTQSATRPEKITKIVKSAALNAYELAQQNLTPLTLAYAQLCYEALESDK